LSATDARVKIEREDCTLECERKKRKKQKKKEKRKR